MVKACTYLCHQCHPCVGGFGEFDERKQMFKKTCVHVTHSDLDSDCMI